MRQRILALAAFQFGIYYRSLASLTPLGLFAGLYQLGFHFGGDVNYFLAIGGIGMTLIALVVTAILCQQVNRASSYPLLARLPRRSELLAVLWINSLLITTLIALLLTALLIVMGKITPLTIDILWVAPRWLVLFLFTTALGLHLSKLVSQRNSYIVALGVIALIVTGLSRNGSITLSPLGVLHLLAWPFSQIITGPVDGEGSSRMVLGAGVVLLSGSAVFFWAACWLFRKKDLIWSE